MGIALGEKTLSSKLQTRRKSCAADGMNEAEDLTAMKSGEGEATESHRYLAEISMVKMLRLDETGSSLFNRYGGETCFP